MYLVHSFIFAFFVISFSTTLIIADFDGYIDAEEQFVPPITRCKEDFIDISDLQIEPMVSDSIYNDQLKQIKVIKDPTFSEHCNFYTKSHGFECVPYYQCEDGTILTDGAGLIDIRFNAFGYSDGGEPEVATLDASDKKCQGSLDICCRDSDFEAIEVVVDQIPKVDPEPEPKVDLEPAIAPNPYIETTTTTSTTTTTTTTTPPPTYYPQCGRKNDNGLKVQIAGYKGGETQIGEWPWICAVLEKKLIDGEWRNLFTCGASLISPGVVLTAGHCLQKASASNMVVRCGEWDTQTTSEPYDHQDREVESFEIHPQFNKRNLRNDYGVIFVKENFVLAKHVDTICLPQPNEIFKDTDRCIVNGWGKDKFGKEGEYQVVLKEIDLPIMNNTQCQYNFQTKTRLGRRFKLHPSFICAGGEEGRDACKGDGGGSLACPLKAEPHRFVQAGIVAWGIGCGKQDIAGVYASVSHEICWVDWITSCHNGNGNVSSLFGYDSRCQEWLESKASSPGGYGQTQNNGFINENCQVDWAANDVVVNPIY